MLGLNLPNPSRLSAMTPTKPPLFYKTVERLALNDAGAMARTIGAAAEQTLHDLVGELETAVREWHQWNIFAAYRDNNDVRRLLPLIRRWILIFQRLYVPRTLDYVEIARGDVAELQARYLSYGDSWKQRGGVGAYMVGIRKYDRLCTQAAHFDGRIRETLIAQAFDPDGALDDLIDLRRYLYLWEAVALDEVA